MLFRRPLLPKANRQLNLTTLQLKRPRRSESIFYAKYLTNNLANKKPQCFMIQQGTVEGSNLAGPNLEKARAASLRAKQKISEIAKGEASAEEPPSDAESQWTDNTSVAASASKQVADDMEKKLKNLERANAKLKLAEKQAAARADLKLKLAEQRCAALESRLNNTSKKRSREKEVPQPDKASSPNPEKKPSPDPKPEGASFLNLSMSSTAAVCGDESSDSLEPPEAPASVAEDEEQKPDLLYEGLNSVLCAYKAKKLHPNKDGLTYGLCAELCREEREASKRWNRKEKAKYMPMIMSALKLVFPNPKKDWSTKKFLETPGGVASYWRTVLDRRAEAWEEADKKEKLLREAFRTPLKQRIRAKIRLHKRKRSGASALSHHEPHSGSKDSPISIKVSSSDDSSDEECTPAAAPAEKPKVAKMAPGPETYSKAEIKNFQRVADSIRKVDEGINPSHSAATADFIDVEFGSNLGRAKSAWASKSPWKKERFKQACTQAAKIMEERSECLYRNTMSAP